MIDFDPNNSATESSGLFALPYATGDASLVIVPVPWDATSSQARASGGAPDAVFAASKYVELFDPKLGPLYRKGIAMDAAREEIATLNSSAVAMQDAATFHGALLTKPCERLNDIVEGLVRGHLAAGKRVGLLGGDHSVSYGSIAAHLSRHPDLGILQIDAHCDLRCAFDEVVYSHASIMYNVMEQLNPAALVQVGVRGLCDFEADYVRQSDRVTTFFDADLHDMRSVGMNWKEICSRVVTCLPPEVYVSLDIDGLEPSQCPDTGTPVPGGLAYNDVLYLLRSIDQSGRRVVGFDLVEVAANEFDATIAAHLLYQLCGVVAEPSVHATLTNRTAATRRTGNPLPAG